MEAIISILAIIFSPLIALQISKMLEERKERRQRKLYIFQTLMMTRASRLSTEHVRALNMIDVEFYGDKDKDKKVVEAWKVYLDHMNETQSSERDINSWISKGDDLFIDMMQKMALNLNYEFDKSTLRKTSYYPKGYADLESDMALLRSEIINVIRGKKGLPIVVMNETASNKTESDLERSSSS